MRLFAKRKDHYEDRVANKNVDGLVKNINTSKKYYELSLFHWDIDSLTDYGISENDIKLKIKPICNSNQGKFEEFDFEISYNRVF
jgi:hypothetical protein